MWRQKRQQCHLERTTYTTRHSYRPGHAAGHDDDEIAYFTVRWKTRKLVLSPHQKH